MKPFLLAVLITSCLVGMLILPSMAYPNNSDVDDDDDDSGSDSDSNEHGVVPTDIKTNCSCGWANKEDQRIVNGTVTKVHEYPMIVGLVRLYTDEIVCGGTIITERHIVTAGHCAATFQPSDMAVHVGHYSYEKIKKDPGTQLLEIEEFVVHEKYYFLTLIYDVAIVVLKKPLEFNQNVGPACLPTAKIPLEGKKVRVLGWGHIKYKGPTSPELLKVSLDFVPLEKCKVIYHQIQLDDIHQVCTYTKHRDSCNGDSGGPLLWLDPDTNRYTLVAATSYGYNCARYPAVNTDVFYFLPWIQRVISRYPKMVAHPATGGRRIQRRFLPWLQKRSLESSTYRTCAKVI